MKILLISECFGPENAVGAIRVTKTAKYLTKIGHTVTVITSSEIKRVDPILIDDIHKLRDIIRIPHSNFYTKIHSIVFCTKINAPNKNIKSYNNEQEYSESRNNRFKDLLRNIRDFIMMYWNELDFYFSAKKAIGKLLKSEKFDLIISSFKPMSSHLIADYFKRKYKIRWIADFRDPIDTQESRMVKCFYKKREKRFLHNADCLIAASRGFANMISTGEKKTNVITNGYDTEDWSYISESEYLDHNVLNFTYVGSLYDTRQKLTSFFRVLRKLINDEKIDINKISVNYIGSKGYKLINQAHEFNLECIVNDMGFVDRVKSLQIQNESDIMLLASWNDADYYGVLPAKVYEYMLLRKPVIACVVGNLPNSEIKGIIEACGIGIVNEETDDDSKTKNFEENIIALYEEFVSNGKIVYKGIERELDKYSYAYLIELWNLLITNNERKEYNG